ncbi:MAG: hypothetical protein HKM95_10380, partial [Inquilinus sp.]|nr:hypothetical protein [Inquilinus sp.]
AGSHGDGEPCDEAAPARQRPPLLNSCHAFASDSEIVEKYWPDFYTGDRAAE